MVHKNFVRGWEAIDERTLSLLTTNYLEMTDFIRKIMDMANENLRNASTEHLRPFYLTTQQYLQAKLMLCEKAKDNINEVWGAFTNATPIWNNKLSPKRRYDQTYIVPSLILVNDNADRYFNSFEIGRQRFCDEVKHIQNMVERLYEYQLLNFTSYEKSRKTLESRARSYNYRRYTLMDTVVSKTDEAADQVKNEFTAANKSMTSRFLRAERTLDEHVHVLQNMMNSWHWFLLFNNKTRRYVEQDLNKTELADFIFSDAMISARQRFKSRLEEVQLSYVRVEDELQKTKREIQRLWEKMLNEEATRKFYLSVNIDVRLARNDETVLEELDGVFAYMVGKDTKWIATNLETLDFYMNAGFPSLSPAQIGKESDEIFSNFSQLLDLHASLDGNEDLFFEKLHRLEATLKDFMQETALGSNFFMYEFVYFIILSNIL